MTPHRHRPRDRPPWWPANEPWPPTGPPWMWRGQPRWFLWRVVGAFALLLIALSIVLSVGFWMVAGTLGLVAVHPAESWRAYRLGPFLGFILLLAIFLLVRAFRRAAMPIADLIEAARHIEEGDYSVRVPERGPSEVRALARSFNAMSANLEASSQQRRGLLADVTHELRTPLTVIQGNIEGLIDGVYPADQQRLAELLEETRVLGRLIDDLRVLTLAESGALELRREPTDIGALVAETVGWHRASAEAAGVDLTTEVAEGLPLLRVDPARIRQVLENLLSNALRHTPRGGRIAVGCVLVSGGRQASAIEVSVKDSGAGIDPADLPHVFERFYRGRDSSGTGLGLAIVKDLVEAHGGRVGATSEPGNGTTITCTFPPS